MTITPDQARELLDGATPGPWDFDEHDAIMNGRVFKLRQPGKPGIRVSATAYGHNGDPELIAAAPDMAETIAGMTIQYGIMRDLIMAPGYRRPIWFNTEAEARKEMSRDDLDGINPRLVRRLVSDVEVVDGE